MCYYDEEEVGPCTKASTYPDEMIAECNWTKCQPIGINWKFACKIYFLLNNMINNKHIFARIC